MLSNTVVGSGTTTLGSNGTPMTFTAIYTYRVVGPDTGGMRPRTWVDFAVGLLVSAPSLQCSPASINLTECLTQLVSKKERGCGAERVKCRCLGTVGTIATRDTIVYLCNPDSH